MIDGYVNLHRKAIDSRVFSDAELWKHWCWLLLRANFADGWFQGVLIPRGSFAAGTRSAAEILGSSPTTIHRQWKRFAEWKMIELKPERNFTIITICNYDTYNNPDRDGETQTERKRNASETPVKRQRNADETLAEPIEKEQTKQTEPKEQTKPPLPPKGETDSAAAEAWAKLIKAWNAAPGVQPCRASNDSRRRALKTRISERLLLDGKPTPWIDAALQAIGRKFPLKCFEGSGDFTPGIDFFLRPKTVMAILEGKYDWAKNDGKQQSRLGPGQRFDPASVGDDFDPRGW